MNNDITYEVLKIVIMVIGIVITYYVVPYIKANTTLKQRQDAEYWLKKAVQVAESIYKEKGQGVLKKEYVLEWLEQNGLKITESQANILVDLIVKQFNESGWE